MKYVENLSFTFDLKIFKTIKKVFTNTDNVNMVQTVPDANAQLHKNEDMVKESALK